MPSNPPAAHTDAADSSTKVGRKLRKFIKQRSMDVLLGDVHMLKLLFPHNIEHLEPQDRAIALLHLFLTGSSDNIIHYLLEHISAELLNCVVETGKYQGGSMLFYLCYLPRGRALLLRDDFLLARLVRPDALNCAITSGEFKGQSPAFHLLLTVDQDCLLLQEFLQVHLLLSARTLNHVICTSPPGPYQDLSVAFLLASTPHGRNLLQLHNNHLCELLTPASVNHVIRDQTSEQEQEQEQEQEGSDDMLEHKQAAAAATISPLSGQSPALLLLRSSARGVFTACFLRRGLVAPCSLAARAWDPSFGDETVAFWLSRG
jgi:hypothetical protein